MRDSAATGVPTIDQLRPFVQGGVDALSPPGRIASLARRPSPYRSSYPLEELTISLEDGRRLEWVFKNASRAALTPTAQQAKPLFVYDAHREIEVYRSILAPAAPGTAHCHAAVADGLSGRFWLCMETVGGLELYQVGELRLWERVAEWLAEFHARFATNPGWRTGAAGRHLLRLDRALMQTWFDRARLFALERADAPAIAALTALDACWDDVVGTLTSWPRTLVHGECYASNVLVDAGQTPARVCPIDWEMAGDGAGIIDLAALTAGAWTGDEPSHITDAYYQASARRGLVWPRSVFDRTLTCARIYIAVQWLGWASDWTPPAEHRHDWAATLARLAGKLDA